MAINTRIITHEFVYLVPKTIEETVQLLNQYGSDAKIIAGGTDLLLQIKQEKISPGYLINVMKIPELSQIKEDDRLRIGAATKLGDVRKYCSKRKAYTALYEAVSMLGKVQVWNMGTIGGNLCNASPAADTAPPLLVLNGRVKLLGKDGEKTLSLEDFFKGVNTTAMAPDEIMVEIHLDPIPDQMGSAFMKIARVGADISKISCAVAVERDGKRCALCRIALGAVAPVPMRAKGAESILQGSKIDASLIHRAGQKLAEEVKPIDDVRSTAEYRRAVAAVLFKDVFWKAWSRASGEEK
jgi:CO/xanthine dehydrogenase FAD-binding subunit